MRERTREKSERGRAEGGRAPRLPPLPPENAKDPERDPSIKIFLSRGLIFIKFGLLKTKFYKN